MQIRHPYADIQRPRLLITGASTRAAAWSALRAGFFPVCADRFGDEDLRQVAEVYDFDKVEREWHAGHLAFVTSARLNVSGFVFDAKKQFLRREESRQYRTLLGPLLGQNQFWTPRFGGVAKPLKSAGLPFLSENEGTFSRLTKVIGSSKAWSPPPSDGTWIEKPTFGGGGRNIRIWDKAATQSNSIEPTYFQEYRAGQPMSAIFLADRNRPAPVELVGLTEQLIGDETAAAPTRFTYCGNIAPVALPPEATQVVQRIGEVLADKLKQCGIFGIDFIWDGTTPWVVEVNPRYTASCELLELAHGRTLLRDHWQAWLPQEPLPLLPEPSPTTRSGVIGKLILYARSKVTAPDLSRFLRPRSPWTIPFLADIPRQGTPFQPGEPMCTVFATAPDTAKCHRKLARRAQRVRKWFQDGI